MPRFPGRGVILLQEGSLTPYARERSVLYVNEEKTQMLSTPAPHRRVVTRLSGFWTGLLRKGGDPHGRRSFCCPLVRCGLLLLLCAALMLGAVMTASLAMIHSTKGRVTSPSALANEAGLSEYDCILVLGAGVRADGSPSEMLRDRVSVACDLYESLGDPDLPLLMSGDHTGDYNEVGVMKKLATEQGVPSERIFLDHEGYSTYESIYRARYVFGVKKMVIVTQGYHLYRALHIARELGIEAVGIPSDLRDYRKQMIYEARETLARYKDMFSAARGDYDGRTDPPIDLDGDGNQTN